MSGSSVNGHSRNGTNPESRAPVWERVSLFSTTAAFVLVALLIDRPVFFAAAGFAALAAVGGLYAGRYPRESRAAIWVGRIGMIVIMVVVAALMLLGR